MSYDLHFCCQDDHELEISDMIDYFRSAEHFKVPTSVEGSFLLNYENADSGVYFTVDYEVPVEADGFDEIIPDGYKHTGFFLSVNLGRDSCFAVEAMAAAISFCEAFDLAIFDPQTDQLLPKDSIRPSSAASLLKGWKKTNSAAAKALGKLGIKWPGG